MENPMPNQKHQSRIHRLFTGLILITMTHAQGNDISTNKEIAAWAKQPMTGPAGRPLPLAGSWQVEDNSHRTGGASMDYWGPAYMTAMVQQGHYVLPAFIDSFSAATWVYAGGRENRQEQIDGYKERWLPVLEYLREHRLPFAIRGWNWDTYAMTYQRAQRLNGAEIPREKDVILFQNGEPSRYADPMGPIESWRELGAFWLGNPLAKWMQEIYPDPPLVIMLNNNEAGKMRSARDLAATSDRYRARYGDDASHAPRILKEGYHERRQAMCEAARQASGSWGKSLRFVAYNTLWNTMEVGRKDLDLPAEGYPVPKPWDGSILELYDNDWQPGKADFRTWSMQAEALNTAGVLPDILRQEPDFFWSTIVWDGSHPANVYRPRGNPVATTSKTYYYATRGQRWDAHRFEGWIQFGLWAERPRLCSEFRGGGPRDAYRKLTWQALVRCIDRPWKNAVLREFWRHGKLVPNRAEPPFWQLKGHEPEWLRKLDRWFLLTSSANPPRAQVKVTPDSAEAGQRLPDRIVDEDQEWDGTTHIAVWSIALELGEAPKRRWLIYAHAPQGDVLDSTVALPGHGRVKLPRIPVSGSFFLVEEGKARTTVLIEGEPGQGGSPPRSTDAPETTVYDLPLDEAIAWEGPWGPATDDFQTLVTYRHVPNRGAAPPAVLSGGRFVDDPERGRVLELAGADDGLWLIANKQTVMANREHGNRTIAFWVKPEDVTARQVLYAEGNHGVGLNIHLADGKIIAGAWAPKDQLAWDGAWITGPAIESGKWTHVALLLDGADRTVQPDRLKLYVDSKPVGTAPGVALPKSYTPPRFAQPGTNRRGNPITRFTVELGKRERIPTFHGRFDDIQLLNQSIAPSQR
jgi:hypothetical protein